MRDARCDVRATPSNISLSEPERQERGRAPPPRGDQVGPTPREMVWRVIGGPPRAADPGACGPRGGHQVPSSRARPSQRPSRASRGVSAGPSSSSAWRPTADRRAVPPRPVWKSSSELGFLRSIAETFVNFHAIKQTHLRREHHVDWWGARNLISTQALASRATASPRHASRY